MKDLQLLFERLVEVVKLDDNHHLYLDYNPYYGGYRIDIVDNKTGGCGDFGGLTRKSNKEMIAFIRGYLLALNK